MTNVLKVTVCGQNGKYCTCPCKLLIDCLIDLILKAITYILCYLAHRLRWRLPCKVRMLYSFVNQQQQNMSWLMGRCAPSDFDMEFGMSTTVSANLAKQNVHVVTTPQTNRLAQKVFLG